MSYDAKGAADVNIWRLEMMRLLDGGGTLGGGGGSGTISLGTYIANTAGTGYAVGNIITLTQAPPSAPVYTNTVGGATITPDGAHLSPIGGVLPPALTPVIYRLNNGTLKTGYLRGSSLFSDILGTASVTIGTNPTEAIAASIEPARSYYLSSQSFPIAHAGALVNSFTQPAIGAQVAITATALETATGSELQFGVGAEVFISNGAAVAGRYIVRSAAWPNISIELQNPALNELGSAQTAIAPGANVPAMRMIAMSRVTASAGATHAKVSITRSRVAIGSALTGINSASLPIVEQAYQDKAQSDYPAVAMNDRPATLGWDEGPKEWIFDTIELSQERLNFWLYAFADEGRTIHATIRWLGGVSG